MRRATVSTSKDGKPTNVRFLTSQIRTRELIATRRSVAAGFE
jgi:hypothetical protein